MKGQLWQECPRCGAEPVCGACEQCEHHWHCESDAAQRTAFDQAYPGLRQRIAAHQEPGAHEH